MKLEYLAPADRQKGKGFGEGRGSPVKFQSWSGV